MKYNSGLLRLCSWMEGRGRQLRAGLYCVDSRVPCILPLMCRLKQQRIADRETKQRGVKCIKSPRTCWHGSKRSSGLQISSLWSSYSKIRSIYGPGAGPFTHSMPHVETMCGSHLSACGGRKKRVLRNIGCEPGALGRVGHDDAQLHF